MHRTARMARFYTDKVMKRSPQDRLAQQAEHALRAWELIRREPETRQRAQIWLEEHPSGWQEVDRLWRDCLDGEGPLADWLASGGDPSTWDRFPALHSVLASHPFPGLLSWSNLPTSHAS